MWATLVHAIVATQPPSSQPIAARRPQPATEEFWALNDVSFEVKQGERVGREPMGRGRNGAGKSTLLKILSRIPSPTKGRIHIKGRVASLLEVAGARGSRPRDTCGVPFGTGRDGRGFHPELTGRETIYLNGAILGMSRSAIRRKLDEVVAFAPLQKWNDNNFFGL